jgi:type IV pilus assembly protein PilM
VGLGFLTALKRPAGAPGDRGSSRRVGPIGLDFALERVNLLQLERNGAGLRIRAAASVAYPEEREALMGSPAALKALLRKARAGRPFAGRRVVTAMPRDTGRLFNLTYEGAPDGDEAAVVRATQERLASDLKDWVIDYLPIRQSDSDKGERSAIVVAAPRAAVVEYLETLRQAGLEVEALEVGPVAIRRLVASLGQSGDDGNVLVINFGKTQTYLSAVWGRRLILNREVDFGEASVLEQLSRQLDLPLQEATALPYECGVYYDQEADWGEEFAGTEDQAARAVAEILKPAFARLVQEVSKALIYASSVTRGASVHKVYLFGGIARWPGADRLLASLLSLPVEIPDPFQAFLANRNGSPSANLTPVAHLGLAAGFALRGMQPDG